MVSLVLMAFAVVPQALAGSKSAFPEPSDLPSIPQPPDPLVRFNGKPVTTQKEWFSKRRPELKKLVQQYMYGYFPDRIRIKPVVDSVDPKFFNGKATLKLVTLGFSNKELPPISLMLITPNNVKQAPVFVALNFNGNHALVTDKQIPLPTGWVDGKEPFVVNHRATDAGRGLEAASWAIERTVDRGYAIAAFYYGDVEPDNKNATTGVRSVITTGDRDNTHWGAVAAWAWGVQRVVDFLVKEKTIDPKRIAVVGHSRLGKAALLAGAFDERIALICPHQSGCGGTAPSRGTVGESVTRINTVFPHWFDGNFKQFGSQPDRLPFDQNCVIALCAPRPILVTCAVEDAWSNPAGQFDMLKAADKLYRWLGTDGLAVAESPQPNLLIDSTEGYFIRPGIHSMKPEDWAAFLAFADKHFGKPASEKP
jgi:hypothetical protein